jgi:hypothetical protein
MANFSKPIVVPRWADVGGNIVAATEGQKDTGWTNSQVPPSGVQNEWQNLVGEWWKWIGERIADGATADEIVVKDPATGNGAAKVAGDGVRHVGGLLVGDTSALTGTVQDGVVRSDGLNVGGISLPSSGGVIVTTGLAVGFDSDPAPDSVEIGNADHAIAFSGGVASWSFAPGDSIEYDTATNSADVEVGSSSVFGWSSAGLSVSAGKQITLGASGQLIGSGTSSISLFGTGAIQTAVGNITTNTGDLIATNGDITAVAGAVSGVSVSTSEQGIRHSLVSRQVAMIFSDTAGWSVGSASNVPYLQALAGAPRTLHFTLPVMEGERLRTVSLIASGGTGIPGDTVSLEIFSMANGNPPVATSLGSNSASIEIGIGSFFLTETLSPVHAVSTLGNVTARVVMDGHANARIYGLLIGVDRI